MIGHAAPQGSHHHSRHYLILGTVLVVGIFVLLLLNDDGTTLTGNLAGLHSVDESSGDVLETLEEGDGVATTGSKDTAAKVSKAKRTAKIDHSFTLDVSQIPETEQEAAIVEQLTVIFSDLDTVIRIDEEELSLRDLDSVKLGVSDFEGDIILDEFGLSLDGTGKEIVVNGIVLSTDKSLELSVSRIDFESVEFINAVFNEIEFKDVFGDLVLEAKLTYSIEGEDLTLGSFVGDATFNSEGSKLNGKVSSFDLDGGLDVNVKN